MEAKFNDNNEHVEGIINTFSQVISENPFNNSVSETGCWYYSACLKIVIVFF